MHKPFRYQMELCFWIIRIKRKKRSERDSRFYAGYGRNLERVNETESIRKERSRTKGESERAGKGRAAFRWKPKKHIRFQLDRHDAVAFTPNLPRQRVNFRPRRVSCPSCVGQLGEKKVFSGGHRKNRLCSISNLASFKLDKWNEINETDSDSYIFFLDFDSFFCNKCE